MSDTAKAMFVLQHWYESMLRGGHIHLRPAATACCSSSAAYFQHPSDANTGNAATASRQLSQLHLEHHLIQARLQGVHLPILSNTEEAASLVSSQTQAICLQGVC